MMGEFCLLYSTFPNEDLAQKVGYHLVETRAAACINLIPGIKSIYSWNNQICKDHEFILIVKTTKAKASLATQKIVELHEHNCPCVVQIDIQGGHKDYLDWLKTQTETKTP